MRFFIISFFLLSLTPVFASSDSGSHGQGQPVNIDLNNRSSLQRGAKYFVNYCLSCHAAKYSRYKRVAEDLGIGEELAKQHLIFTGQKYGDLMTVAMRGEDAKKWFLGIQPPDLTDRSRARGADYIYRYLKSFYLDAKRPFGVNNTVLANTAMPHVLWELQGWQKPIYETASGNGESHHKVVGFELATPGRLTSEEYDQVITDIVNFLVYMGEPAQLKRKAVGVGVIAFLLVLALFAYLMKRDYWKDVH